MRARLWTPVTAPLGAAWLGAFAVLHACTGKAPGGDTAPRDGGAADSSDAAFVCEHAEPPAPPDVVDAGGTLDLVFAVEQECLGTRSTDDAGNLLYKRFGFDLDHTCTGEGEGASCAEPPSALPIDHTDGVAGIDNGVVQLALATGAQGPSVAECAMNTASSTVEIYRVRDYSGAPDDDHVEVSQYFGFGLSPRADGVNGPLWDGTDQWTVDPDTLVGSSDGGVPWNKDQPRYRSTTGYVTGFMLVAEFDDAAILAPQPAAPTPLLPLSQLVLVGRLVPPRDAGAHWDLRDVIEGSRIPVTTELLGFGLAPPSAGADPPCSSRATYQMLKDTVCPFVDIASLPGSPKTAPCDAFSAGLSLTMAPALLGDVGSPALPFGACAQGIHPETDSCQ
ncbi:MAG TPA: hypothetical protein VKU41_17735 [Polyangiaceae bacterium]|nr:hypothetical protein [Polyangiaceae bacterium]